MCALHNKIKKQLAVETPEPKGNKIRHPLVLSDSKGSYLRNEVNYKNTTEKTIEWKCIPGADLYRLYMWLRDNLDRLVNKHKTLSVFIWAGTCDLTTKRGKFISLVDKNNSGGAVHKFRENLEKITSLRRRYSEDAVHITILEVPPYSIANWNTNKGHSDPIIFQDEDNSLKTQVGQLNDIIRECNTSLSTNSPKLGLDIQNCRKTKGQSPKYTVNFKLYKDGIHPLPTLSKLWLRRIVKLTIVKCYDQNKSTS
jgi:hypothetical protein